jgi:nucleoside-diphosphate-sugar epimerase
MTIAVTGATGFVGHALLDLASAEGVPLRALTRRPQKPREGVEWVRGDLSDTQALTVLAEGARAVIHVAGVVNAPDTAGFEEGNVTGTANVLAAARTAKVERFVFVSSLSAREPGLSAYGASKARAEELVRNSDMDWTIVRPPAIYGPRDKEMLELFRAAKWGVVPVPKHGAASMIHVDDLARLLLALAPTGEGLSGEVLEPDDGRPGGWPHGDMARAIGDAVGKRVRVLGLSPGILKLAARIDTLFRGKNAKMTADRASYFAHPDWVVSDAARPPSPLWQPRIETRAGLARTARWYRDEGWL